MILYYLFLKDDSIPGLKMDKFPLLIESKFLDV